MSLCECVSVCVNPSVVSNSLWRQGLQPTSLLGPWDFPGKNTGVGSHSLLQGIFLTQGSNPGLLHLQANILSRLSHQGSPAVSIQSVRAWVKLLCWEWGCGVEIGGLGRGVKVFNSCWRTREGKGHRLMDSIEGPRWHEKYESVKTPIGATMWFLFSSTLFWESLLTTGLTKFYIFKHYWYKWVSFYYLDLYFLLTFC